MPILASCLNLFSVTVIEYLTMSDFSRKEVLRLMALKAEKSEIGQPHGVKALCSLITWHKSEGAIRLVQKRQNTADSLTLKPALW
jgi:hypothetical protein